MLLCLLIGMRFRFNGFRCVGDVGFLVFLLFVVFIVVFGLDYMIFAYGYLCGLLGGVAVCCLLSRLLANSLFVY